MLNERFEIIQSFFTGKDTSLELLGLQGFEKFLEAGAGLEAHFDEVLAGDKRLRDQRLVGKLITFGEQKIIIFGESVR